MTSLHLVVRNSQIEEVRQMIANGVDLNQTDELSRTALHIAAWKGNAEILQLLLRAKASAHMKAKDNFTALHFAIQSGSIESCQILLKYDKSLANSRISKGNKSALHLAASKGNFEIVKELLEAGADPSAMTSTRQSVLDVVNDPLIFNLIKEKIQSNLDKTSRALKRKEEVLEEQKAKKLESVPLTAELGTVSAVTHQIDPVDPTNPIEAIHAPPPSSSSMASTAAVSRASGATKERDWGRGRERSPSHAGTRDGAVSLQDMTSDSATAQDISDVAQHQQPVYPARAAPPKKRPRIVLSHLSEGDDP